MLHPKQVLFNVSDCRYFCWFCCFLTSPNFRAMSFRHRHRARSGFMHRHSIAGKSGFKCLPRIQSIFHPEEQRTLFCGKLTGKCHPCSFPAAKSPLLVLFSNPHCHIHSGNDFVGSRGGHCCGWAGGWISLSRHSPSVLK